MRILHPPFILHERYEFNLARLLNKAPIYLGS